MSQQAENGVLDFQDYATYVINVLAQLCAPVRDEEIAALRAMSSDVVPLFQVRQPRNAKWIQGCSVIVTLLGRLGPERVVTVTKGKGTVTDDF